MNCFIFVTVRTASTRLPKKALLDIDDKPLIRIIVERMSQITTPKKIVICTTNLKSDDKLVRILKKYKINVFRGSSKDILDRLYRAAAKYNVKQFIVVEGDDFFCDLDLVKKTCRELMKTDYEFLVWKNLPFGVSPLGIKTDKLQQLIENKSTKNTETGWGRFITKSGFFKVGTLEPKNKKLIRPDIRLSVDYPEDFQLIKKLYTNLPRKFSLKHIIDLLDKNPEWLRINESVKKKYKENFEKKMAKIALRKKEARK